MSMPVTVSHIEHRHNRAGEIRAYVIGTRIRVQDIASDHERHGLSPEQIVCEHPHLTLGQVHAALAYYYDHLEEIRGHIKADEEYARRVEVEQKRAQRGSADKDVDRDSVSS